MLAKYEFRRHHENSKVWFGRYLSPINLPHWHYDAEIILCRQGEAEISIDGKAVRLEEGDAAYVASRQIHWVNGKGAILDFLIFDHSLLGESESLCLEDPLRKDAKCIASLMEEVVAEKKGKKPLYKDLCDAKVVQTVSILLRNGATYARKEANPKETRYLALLEKIEQDYGYIRFEEASAFMGFTPAYFSNYFKRMSGVTFSSYLNAVRIEKAVPLIQEGKKRMGEIAIECGFNTIRNFNRVFREITGYAPHALPSDYSLSSWQMARDLSAFNPTAKESLLLESTAPDNE